MWLYQKWCSFAELFLVIFLCASMATGLVFIVRSSSDEGYHCLQLQVFMASPKDRLLQLLPTYRLVSILDRVIDSRVTSKVARQRAWRCSRLCRVWRAVGVGHTPGERQCWGPGLWRWTILASATPPVRKGAGNPQRVGWAQQSGTDRIGSRWCRM